MGIKSFLAIGVIGIVLTGCTTLKDFQKMTPPERASKTCLNDSLVSHYRNNERAYSKEIRSLDDILMKGYTVVENCTTTIIDISGNYNKNTKRYEYDPRSNRIIKVQSKYQPPKKKTIRTCRSQTIPLTDYAISKYTERKIELMPLLSDAKKSGSNEFDVCYNKIVNYSAEKAFSHYKR